LTEEHTLRLEVDRLTSALDKVERHSEAQRDIIRAAQRLYDEIHLAGTTTVTIVHPVDPRHYRQPDSYTTTIVSHGPNLVNAIRNLNDALKHYYTPEGPRP
jgi:hypothetical protein